MQLLKVSHNRRFLVLEDGTPFFWLGDTAWELIHKLNREEAALYLQTRAEQRFNVIQTVALAEFDGLRTPNAYGRKPLKADAQNRYDPAMPDTDGDGSYWDHVDYIIDHAASLGLYVALLPTWGDKFNQLWGQGPSVFTPENAASTANGSVRAIATAITSYGCSEAIGLCSSLTILPLYAQWRKGYAAAISAGI